ncbi:MAG: CarD family transcriptional regulator [Desulfovibrio sp.]|uniref:CarD family transcriptional regulator n=1 Tax=Desulfovibrio sp. TaxID=885 RepID=UPI001A73062A|nr:CarD family transcriptional regulator [Desulfovibrio sp.]MBD5418263.1 CarD family transcriptional regulator [Desulfovibrio sp.]
MFSPDKLVVYPAQGVGRIERIDHKDIGGVACEFYIVRIRANNITLMVPVHNAVNVGLRPLITRKEASRILDMLRSDRERTVFTGQNWNRRFREYSERLKSPELAVVADVLRELLLIGRTKELSFGERRLLEQAMSLVGGELAEVLGLSAEELRDELTALYAAAQPAAETHCQSA